MHAKSKVRFIAEEPAKEDQFGVHKRIATGICTVLKESDDARSIGILGEWGSGKSTILDMAKTILSNSEDIRRFEFFIYDAWLHQSDPTRRSLLEKLVEFLTAKGVEDAKSVCDLESLSGEKSTQENQSEPMLRPAGVALAIALAMVPVGLVLMRSEDALTLFGMNIFLIKNIGYSLMFGPLIVLVCSFFLTRESNKFWRKEFWYSSKKGNGIANITALLFNKIPDRVIITARKHPDPTAIEFHAAFSALIQAANRAKIDVVIVIDNLDRVDTKDALLMWSVMRSFFDHTMESEEGKQAYRTRMILPFDTGSLVRLYAEGKEIDDSAKDRAQAFIEKTFDVVFQVGPPISSDWQSYLTRRLSEALGSDIDEEKAFSAYRIYQHKFDPYGTGLGITPRKLNAYINRIAALWIQWRESIELAPVAYYAALSLPGRFEIRDVLNAESDVSPLMGELCSDWRGQVAALHYGVTRDKAFQVLLGPELDAAFRGEGSAMEFGGMVNIAGFETALRTFLETRLGSQPTVDPAYILNTALHVGQNISDRIATRGIWRPILSALPRLSPWSGVAIDAGGGSAQLALREKGASILLAKSLLHMEEASALQDPKIWLTHLKAVVPDGAAAEFWRAVSVPGPASFYLSVLAENERSGARRERPPLARNLRPVVDQAQVEAALLQSLSGKPITEEILRTIRGVDKVGLTWNMKEVVAQLEQRFRGKEDPLGYLMTLEAMVTLYSASDDTLVKMRQDGVMADLFGRSLDASNPRGVALALAAISEQEADISHLTAYGLSTSGQERLDKLDDSISLMFDGVVEQYLLQVETAGGNAEKFEADVVPFLLRMAAKNEHWVRFSRAVISGMLAGRGLWKFSYPKIVFQEAESAFSLLEESAFRQLMDIHAGFGKLPDNVSKLTPAGFWAVAHSRSSNREFQRWVDEQAKTRLKRFTVDEWRSLFIKDLRLAGQIMRTQAKVSQSDFGDSFSDAAVEWWATFIKGRGSQFRSESVLAMLRRLKKSRRDVLIQNALDVLLGSGGPPSQAFIERILPAMEEFNGFGNDGDRIARTVVLGLLESDDEKWVSSVLRSAPSLARPIEKASRSTIAEISGQLDRISRREGAVSVLATQAARTWKLLPEE